MSDRRKLNRHNTGTVPKVKYTVKNRNNTNGQQQQPYTDQDNLRNLQNNLNSEWPPAKKSESNFHRNSPYNLNFESMDSVDEAHHLNEVHVNGTSTSSRTSSLNSRRNSGNGGAIPKCDNVVKYPNKKQIEEKLNQIKEYLHITTSLMSSMKNSDEQHQQNEKDHLSTIIEALKDSEVKLKSLLENEDENFEGVEDHPEATNREILDMQNDTFSDLKCTAERKLRDARVIQEKLASSNNQNNSNPANRMENNFQEYDAAIAKLEETTKRLNSAGAIVNNSTDNNTDKGSVNEFHQQEEERIIDEIEELQSQIQVMHTANEDRNKLIQLLDKRDAELRSQHSELQNKLVELQTRKSQVDQLVSALQNGPTVQQQEEDNNMGMHIQRIVSMKDQLSKLKDMLELVENTEDLMQNGSQEEKAIASEIFNKAENFLNKGNQHQLQQFQQQQSLLQSENNRGSPLRNLDKHSRKQVNNKSNRETRGQSNDSKINEKLALQAELAVKKKELEEIMGKHKASTSNLNHDFGTDNKSEFSCNSLFDNNVSDWMQSHNHDSSERYFSDNGTEDINEYSEMQNPDVMASAASGSDIVAALKTGKYPSERHNSNEYHLLAQSYERMLNSASFTPPDDGNTTRASFSRESSISNMRQGKQNVQKQLELIRSVCDSMLPQNTSNQQVPLANVQNLRNNLTPSPTYSELGTFSAANNEPALQSLDNNSAWVSNGQQAPVVPFTDVANFQSWLTTNTLQAQAFMLTSLNQCYQMLWLQQRELESLRNSVSSLQHPNSVQYNNNSETANSTEANREIPSMSVGNLNSQKAACSLPNLNHYNALVSIFGNQGSRTMNNSINNLEVGRNLNLANETNDNLWNGPALNNQVPPGIRANNYWDNFRSYSRQNLLSNKSNDLVRNSPTGSSSVRTNNLRGAPVEIQQTQLQQQQQIRTSSGRYVNSNGVTVPPDVLNLNHKNQSLSANSVQNDHESDAESPNNFSSYINRRAAPQTSRQNFNITGGVSAERRNLKSRNSEDTSRSKLFEELKENIFKEVASLISANEARPHFLIQLFKDLKLVSSDPLRLKTLQSIQTLTSQSLRNLQSLQDSSPNQEIPPSTLNDFSMQSTVWSPIPPNSVPRNATILEGLISKKETPQTCNIFHEIVPFLNDNEHLTINQRFLAVLKQNILNSESFRREVKDKFFHLNFASLLDDVLNFYLEKPLCTVKTLLVQNIRDLFERELSYMNFSMNFIQNNRDPSPSIIVAPDLKIRSPLLVNSDQEAAAIVQIQNEDLAEADQSHVEDEDVDEEGAVGGILEQQPLESIDEKLDVISQAVESFVTEAESQYQLGLDRVPTRLPTITKSRSNTPNRSIKHDEDQDI